MKNGDKCSKEFFNVFKDAHKHTTIIIISQLLVEENVLSEQQVKASAVTEFYKQLYMESLTHPKS